MFVEGAREFYESLLTKKHLPEHPIDENTYGQKYPKLLTELKRSGWDILLQSMVKANLTLVRELYAN